MERDLALRIKCPFCGEVNTVMVDCDDFNAWQNGELVQNAFPYLSGEEREMLVSGVCPKCWKAMFGIA